MADTQTPRMRALQNLSNQLPVANSRIAQGQKAARDIQLQQAVAGAPKTANIAKTAQDTGAAAAGNAGAQLVESAGNQVKQQGQVGQLALGEQQQQATGNVASLQAGAKNAQMDNVTKLAGVSEAAKQELYDKQMQFQKDEQGRTLFNERQLADYAKSSAKSDEDYRNMAQAATQTATRKLQIMDQAYKLMSQDLQQKISVAEQNKDQKLAMQLAQMKRDADEEMARQKAKAANTSAMYTAGGAIAGAVIGGVASGGNPAGVAAGASLGSAAGGMAASQST